MILIIFFFGLLSTIIGALPPGASNLAVIKTTVKENIHESLKISYGAGAGEVVLAFIAFSSGMVVQEFFEMHLWIQFLTAGILGIAGVYFIKTKQIEKRDKKKYSSKYMTGFTLSIINPPVLIYWVLIFSVLRSSFGLELENYSLGFFLFFSGVFSGKVATLYGYGKLGTRIQKKKSPANTGSLNRMIGVILMSLSLLQTMKLLLF